MDPESTETETIPEKKPAKARRPIVPYVFAALVVLLIGLLAVKVSAPPAVGAPLQTPGQATPSDPSTGAVLPTWVPPAEVDLRRDSVLHTQNGAMELSARTYTVADGDSVFGIANQFGLTPESVLWANFSALKDDPQTISVGLSLNIPPTNGVYYQWKEGDTLESVAAQYKVDPSVILLWPGNHLDASNPQVQPGQYVMIPGGTGEIRQWIIPTVFRPRSGANQTLGGQCTIPPGNYWGTGGFIWPVPDHTIVGNDYWAGHLGIDIAASIGTPVRASDSGVVVYAGPIGGGYGIVVEIEHDTAAHVYHTVYAHLSSVAVHCGQPVTQGQVVAYSGVTGNTTGPHLHFEVREDGGFVNPHMVLP